MLNRKRKKKTTLKNQTVLLISYLRLRQSTWDWEKVYEDRSVLNFIVMISPEKHISFIYMKTGFTFRYTVLHFGNNYLLSYSHVLACYDHFLFLSRNYCANKRRQDKKLLFLRCEDQNRFFFSFYPFYCFRMQVAKNFSRDERWKL